MLGGVAVLSAVHRDQAHEVWTNVIHVPPLSLAGALLLVLCQLAFQALRLWAILPRDAPLTLGRTAYAFTVGEWCNIFAPARAGDALKVVLLNRAGGARPISLPKATGAVLADKIVDAGTLVLLCAATGLVGLIGAGVRARLPGTEITLAGGAVGALVFLSVRLARPRWFARLTLLRGELAKGLSALADPARTLASVVFSLGAWTAELLAIRVLCGALSFPLSPPQLVLALVVLNLGISVPVSLANLGVYEALLVFGLSRSGLPLSAAVAIATLHHGLELLGTNLGAAGLVLWVRRAGGW